MEKITDPKKIFNGKSIKIVAIQKSIPLWQLARLCNIPFSRISDYIAGRRIPSLERIEQIAKVLDVSSDRFYDKEGRPNDFN